MTTEEYFKEWLKVINIDSLNKVINHINWLYQSQSVMPEYKDIFKVFHLCPYNELKAVFLAQDPYPQKGVATGIAFGNREYTKELSPSLEVIKEACIDYSLPHNAIYFDVTLESWVKQGILLLNSSLTVEQNKPNSHCLVWRPFIAHLLTNLSIHESGIIYVLFGSQASSFKHCIKEAFNHVIEVKHPAYYARTHTKMSTELFKEISNLVKNKYGKPVEWYKEL